LGTRQWMARSPWWLNGLVGCRIRAVRAGERVTVTAEGSFIILVLFGAVWIAMPVLYYGWPPEASWLGAAYTVAHGWWASKRVKYLARYATCMVADETPDDAQAII